MMEAWIIGTERLLGAWEGGLILATVHLWYALPLVVSVSLVCAATRHELMAPIMHHAMRFATWVVVIMGAFVVILTLMQRMA